MNQSRIVLASTSPRRRELLAQIGVEFEVVAVEAEEIPRPDETAEAYVRRVAAEKALLGQESSGGQRPVIAADTEVVLDGSVFGKPRDEAHAFEMLARLSGRKHQVITAVSLRFGSKHWQTLSLSEVAMKSMSASEMSAYWKTGEPAGKAGAYAIQGRGAVFISHLSGSFSGVMGLPIYETCELLSNAGIDVLPPKAFFP